MCATLGEEGGWIVWEGGEGKQPGGRWRLSPSCFFQPPPSPSLPAMQCGGTPFRKPSPYGSHTLPMNVQGDSAGVSKGDNRALKYNTL